VKLRKGMTIGIIGGHGRTGQQFTKLFRAQGFHVQVTGSKTPEKTMELVKTADILLFSVPLQTAPEIIRSVCKHAKRKDQLILDVSSLKVDPVRAMQAAKGEVIGMHPLFGPFTDPKGEEVILCSARTSKETEESLKELLEKMGFKILRMTPKEHDALMAIVQVIPHLKSLLIADLLKSMKVDLPKIIRSCTPTYELEFNVVGRFLDDNAELYMPIIFKNPALKNVMKHLQKSMQRAEGIARTKNLQQAGAWYDELKEYFGPLTKRARRHSEACIQTLLKFK
jgi:prephenate dehydrogenase